MAGAAGGGGPGPAAGELPAHGERQQGFLSGLFARDQSCPLMLLETLETSRSRELEPGDGGGTDPTEPGAPRQSQSCVGGWGRGPPAPLLRVRAQAGGCPFGAH